MIPFIELLFFTVKLNYIQLTCLYCIVDLNLASITVNKNGLRFSLTRKSYNVRINKYECRKITY